LREGRPVGGDCRLERRPGRRILEQGRESEVGSGLDGAVVRGQVRGQGVKQLFRFRHPACVQQRQGQVEFDFFPVWFGMRRGAQADDLCVRIGRSGLDLGRRFHHWLRFHP